MERTGGIGHDWIHSENPMMRTYVCSKCLSFCATINNKPPSWDKKMLWEDTGDYMSCEEVQVWLIHQD